MKLYSKLLKVQKSFRKTAIEFELNVRTLLTRYCKKVTYEQLLYPAFESSLNFHHKNARQVKFCLN